MSKPELTHPVDALTKFFLTSNHMDITGVEVIEQTTGPEDLFRTIWSQEWPVEKKTWVIGMAMFRLGAQLSRSEMHPVVIELEKAIQELDDQGIDIKGGRFELFPDDNIRPEQMRKWPLISIN